MVNNISRISDSFSTGGGGNNFENRIQAIFLLSLLVDGFCPIINLKTKTVCFQAKHLGFDTDDIVVFSESEERKGKLLCQIKHRVTPSYNNKVFRSVIAAAWNDFVRENFDKNNDLIAVISAQISDKAVRALRFLHEQAIYSLDSKDFKHRVEMQYFSNSDNKNMLFTLGQCISDANNNTVTIDDLWQFCKIFIVVIFDVDFKESINRTLATALIKCRSSYAPDYVWLRLVNYAAQCNQNAASVNIDKMDDSLRELFAYTNSNVIEPLPITEIDTFLPTIALIGSWNDENNYDRALIEELSGVKYSVFQAKARNLIVQASEYIELNNGNWKVIHKNELIIQCRDYIFEDLLEKIIISTKKILSEKNKQYSDNDFKLIFTSREYNHSESIRKELMKSLCFIKMHISVFKNISQDKIQSSMSFLVKNLLSNTDRFTWISLKDCLHYLAELSPDIYLDCIESEIVNNPSAILSLFPQKKNYSFVDSNFITEILWSLELLAWSPDYLVRTISVLGMLEGLNYEKTNWVNTPLNSIIAILHPSYPQTLADFDKRKNALNCLKNDNRDVFWRVLLNLLPDDTFSSVRTPRPEYLNLKIPEKINISKDEYDKEVSSFLDLAINEASDSIVMLSNLLNQIKYMKGNVFTNYLNCLSKLSVSCDKEQSYLLWHSLRKEMIELKTVDKGTYNRIRDGINLIIDNLEPKDIRYKYRELYEQNAFLMYNATAKNRKIKLEQKKSVAVKEIYNKYGAVDTELCGVSVNSIKDVGNRLGKILTKNQLSLIIDKCYRNQVSIDFTVSCVRSFVYAHSDIKLNETSLNKYDDEFIISVISKIPFEMEIYRAFEGKLCDNTIFWQAVCIPFSCMEEQYDELILLVEKLTKYKRYVAAVNLLGRSKFDIFEAESVCKILIKAGTEKSIDNETIDDYAVQRIIAWLQEDKKVDLTVLSDIDFIYLPIFDGYSEVKPRALYTRLNTDPEYFCSFIELFYKKRNERKHSNKLSEAQKERLFKIVFKCKVTPGYDWKGDFNEKAFNDWIKYVINWSKENDRFTVTMETVGSGLSYAALDETKLPPKAVIEELNKVENDDMRRGYFLGILNQRGVVLVDPEGKPELALSEDYSTRANLVERLGYSRYAEVLKDVSKNYLKEAKRHIRDAQSNRD